MWNVLLKSMYLYNVFVSFPVLKFQILRLVTYQPEKEGKESDFLEDKTY